MALQVTKKRYFNTTCHIVKLNSDYRIEPVNGTPNQREHLSRIFGEPAIDEVTWFRANASFFDTTNPKNEMIGPGRGDNALNVAFDNKSRKLHIEPDVPGGLKEISSSYCLLRGGKICYDGEAGFKGILGPNPRMSAGDDRNGNFVFVASAGRKLTEKGLTSDEQRNVCLEEKLRNAVNFDGGNSAGMMIGNKEVTGIYDGRGLGYIWAGYRKYTLDELIKGCTGGNKETLLKNKSTGVWVNLLQRLLTKAGFICVPDGIFGAKTEAMVKSFQESEKLRLVDGIVGKDTWTALLKTVQTEKKQSPAWVPDNLLVIDAGHGGDELGGGSWYGYHEKDLNLIEAKRVEYLLSPYSPAMVRGEDVTIPVTKRAEAIAGKYKFCISIHHNALSDGTTKSANASGSSSTGCYIFVSSKAGKATIKLAEYIGAAMQSIAGLEFKGIRTRITDDGKDYYAMHAKTGSTGTVIVEPLFMDNMGELLRLNVELIANAYAFGFNKFIQEYYIPSLS